MISAFVMRQVIKQIADRIPLLFRIFYRYETPGIHKTRGIEEENPFQYCRDEICIHAICCCTCRKTRLTHPSYQGLRVYTQSPGQPNLPAAPDDAVCWMGVETFPLL